MGHGRLRFAAEGAELLMIGCFNARYLYAALSLAICNSLHFENLSINFFHYTWALAQIFSIKILRFAADRGLLQTGVCCRLGFAADWGLLQTGVCSRPGFVADRGLQQTGVFCKRPGITHDWVFLPSLSVCSAYACNSVITPFRKSQYKYFPERFGGLQQTGVCRRLRFAANHCLQQTGVCCKQPGITHDLVFLCSLSVCSAYACNSEITENAAYISDAVKPLAIL
jgi:hypothetical protein